MRELAKINSLVKYGSNDCKVRQMGTAGARMIRQDHIAF